MTTLKFTGHQPHEVTKRTSLKGETNATINSLINGNITPITINHGDFRWTGLSNSAGHRRYHQLVLPVMSLPVKREKCRENGIVGPSAAYFIWFSFYLNSSTTLPINVTQIKRPPITRLPQISHDRPWSWGKGCPRPNACKMTQRLDIISVSWMRRKVPLWVSGFYTKTASMNIATLAQGGVL